MDTVAEVLERAWADVLAARVPEHVQGAALTEAVRLRSGGWEPLVPNRSTPAPPQGARTVTSGSAVTKPNGAKKADAEPELLAVPDEKEFFAKFARESGVEEERLREVYRVVKGELHLALTKSALGATETQRNQRVALLSVATRWYVHGEQELGIAGIRDAARAAGYKPSRNLSHHIESVAGTKPVGNGAGKAVRVQGAKIRDAFSGLITDLTTEV